MQVVYNECKLFYLCVSIATIRSAQHTIAVHSIINSPKSRRMRELLTLSLVFACLPGLLAQVQRAHLNENYTIDVETSLEVDHPLIFRSTSFTQMDGFPKGDRANDTFKNMRNVTLVDLNKDGAHDILWGANNRLFADTYEERLWTRLLSGTVIYPPSVADLDKDGTLEIVQATGGSQANSRLYMLDENGNDKTGWPLNVDGHWILTAPTLADVNDDGDIEIIFNERDIPESRLHIVDTYGRPYSFDWPVNIPGTLAITPSIGDVDADGEKEIFAASTTTRYLFGLNGEPEEGWPQTTGPEQRYSFQSPLLIDLNEDGQLEIIGATHGNYPEYYILQADNTYFPGWPKPIPENTWTFNTPTVVKIDGEYQIFMSRPIDERTSDMLYGWDADGRSIENYPLFKSGGLEGFISIADVDGDNEYELVCGSNLLLPDGLSFIHAYEMDDLTEVPGFPIRPRGWTFMNGINIGDVNGDNMMDIVSLSYTQNYNSSVIDSIYLNVYELNVPYSPERVLWGTYKGNNTRDGMLSPASVTPVQESLTLAPLQFSIAPNPVEDILNLNLRSSQQAMIELELFNAQGQKLDDVYSGEVDTTPRQWTHSVNHLPSGMYCISVKHNQQLVQTVKFVKR